MIDHKHARFHLKIAADGYLLIDGIMAFGPMDAVIQDAMEAIKMPPFDLSKLLRFAGNQTLTYDLGVNDSRVHIEIGILSDPGVAPTHRPRRHAV